MVLLKEVLLVGIGGFAGSALRYMAGAGLSAIVPGGIFPIGTLTVNVVGSLLIGLLFPVVDNRLSLLLVTGFCGGFTTFSTFSHELFTLLRTGNYFAGFGYAVASLAICLAMVWSGMWISEKFFSTL